MSCSPEEQVNRRAGAGLLLAVALLAVAPAGCFSYVKQERVQQIEIETDPPGLPIATRDEEDVVPRGQTPVVVEQRYTAFIQRFRRWHWIWPVLFTAATTGSITWWAKSSSDDAGPRVATLLSILSLGIAVTADALCEKATGRVGRVEPAGINLEITPPGRLPETHRVALKYEPGRWKHTIKIADVAGPTSAPALPPLPRGTVLAVFELEDHAGVLAEGTPAQLTVRLAGQLAALDLTVVPDAELRSQLESGSGRLRCFPGTCHGEVGRAVGARKTLWTRLQRLGGACALRGNLYEGGSTMVERTAAVSTDCSAGALPRAVDELARRIGGRAGDLAPP